MIVEWNFLSCFMTPVNLFINQPSHSGLDKSLYFGVHTCVYFKELCVRMGTGNLFLKGFPRTNLFL